MEDIIIKKGENEYNGWLVEQGDKVSCECGWDEMMGLVAALTIPDDMGCLRWMTPKNEKYIPQDGDFVYIKYIDGYTVILCLKGEPDDESFPYYFNYAHDSDLVLLDGWNEKEHIDSYRAATEEEKNMAIEKLREHESKDWDAEKKEVVDLKWIPNEGDSYYYPWLCGKFIPQETWWMGYDVDQQRLSGGWVTRSEEECKSLCDKLNKAIKEVK